MDEVFIAYLSLDSPADLGYAQLIGPTSAFVTIIDDDGNSLVSLQCKILSQTSFPSDALIGFVPDAYSVIERVDRFVNINVELISGQLGCEVMVNFTTQSASATGIITISFCFVKLSSDLKCLIIMQTTWIM